METDGGSTQKQAGKRIVRRGVQKGEENNACRANTIQRRSRTAKKQIQTNPIEKEKLVQREVNANRREGFNRD
jgi:hypothetical protein